MYLDKKEFYCKNPISRRYRHHNDGILHLRNEEVVEQELAKGNFIIYLQPQFSLETHSVIGAEALIRYQFHGEIILPNVFLPVLEDAGFIDKIDTFVFTSICKYIRMWLDQGKSLFPISVNFSATSLHNASLIKELLTIIQTYDVPFKYLVIEITEKMSENVSCDLKKLTTELRNVGFTVAIDDFGTEYANLSLLSEVEFDILKIDKSLIDHVVTNERTFIVLQHISKISRDLVFLMIAEGIEEKAQWKALQLCEIDQGQGFYFSHPIDIEQFEKNIYNRLKY